MNLGTRLLQPRQPAQRLAEGREDISLLPPQPTTEPEIGQCTWESVMLPPMTVRVMNRTRSSIMSSVRCIFSDSSSGGACGGQRTPLSSRPFKKKRLQEPGQL